MGQRSSHTRMEPRLSEPEGTERRIQKVVDCPYRRCLQAGEYYLQSVYKWFEKGRNRVRVNRRFKLRFLIGNNDMATKNKYIPLIIGVAIAAGVL